MAPWAPPFKVACRICYQIEGKLKNYKNDAFYIKAYESLTGYQFEEVPYLSHFCPSCACMLKKLFRFKKQCRSSHYWLMDYMNSGRKVSQPYIRQMQEYRAKCRPVQLKVWRSENQTVVDHVHATKRYKPKPKVVYDIGVSHFSVPKDLTEETWHYRATPRDDFWSDGLTDDEDLDDDDEDDEEREVGTKGEVMRDELADALYDNRPDQVTDTVEAAVPVASTEGSSYVSQGSNPALIFPLTEQMERNKENSKPQQLRVDSPPSKRNYGIIGEEYCDTFGTQPHPTTSSSYIEPKSKKNQQKKQPLTEEKHIHNTQAILKPLEGLFKCHFCSQCFNEQNSLGAHIKMHQGPSHQKQPTTSSRPHLRSFK